MDLDSTHREEVKRDPLTPPNVDRATEMGMIQDMTPRSFSPNVCERKQGMNRKGEVISLRLRITARNAPSQVHPTESLTKPLRGEMVFMPCPPPYTTTSHRDHYTAGNQ